MTEDRSRPNAAARIGCSASESRGGGDLGMARQHTRAMALLNFNLMLAHEKLATTSQVFKFPARGATHDVLET
jgi:hypothetical protein